MRVILFIHLLLPCMLLADTVLASNAEPKMPDIEALIQAVEAPDWRPPAKLDSANITQGAQATLNGWQVNIVYRWMKTAAQPRAHWQIVNIDIDRQAAANSR